MSPGAPARLLATKGYTILDPQRKLIGKVHYNINTEQQWNNRTQYQLKMAETYEYFSEISIEDEGKSEQLITYKTSVNLWKLKEVIKALIDGGSNSGIGGEDMTLIGYYPDYKKVSVGIAGDHRIVGLRLVIFATAIMTDLGLIIGIFHNYTKCRPQKKSIHSKIQLQAAGAIIDDSSKHFSGTQTMTLDSGH